MKTTRPLLRGEFVFQKFQTDYEDIMEEFDEFDPEIPDSIIDLVLKFETDRRVVLELWHKKQYLNRDRRNPQIRLANFFEVCAFTIEFPHAHFQHGEYCGFDSIIGKSIFDKYYPTVYPTDEEDQNLFGIYSINNKIEPLPDFSLVVTKETLL
jgi:hypothetical protein